MATRFLIAWALFESKCFNGFVKSKRIPNFAKEVVQEKSFSRHDFEAAGQHFHDRYQDCDRLRHLLHDQEVNGLTDILSRQFEELVDDELVFMLIVVVYRFRNNIFHGNKGVDTWLQYKTQIEMCTSIMQRLITCREEAHNNGIQATAYNGT
ncbi:hypothetical protein [Methylotuvimicrobium sp. KM1]|uniref:hypothetical protein n=1 Tax=Methylotuvimicrobium sp. KM1 TaxID=3377707 RepID=UPI00384B28D8